MKLKQVVTEDKITKAGKIIKKILWTTADVMVTVAFLKAVGLLPKKDIKSSRKETTYGDAVAAITKSNMISDDKKVAVSLILRTESPGYYDAVIAIALSTMRSADRLSAIAGISRKEE